MPADTWKNYWIALKVPDFFLAAAACLILVILFSVAAGALARRRSGGLSFAELGKLALVLFLWTLPTLSIAVTRRALPFSERLYDKHDISGLFLEFWQSWSVHEVEVLLRGAPESSGAWQALPLSHFFSPGMFGGLSRGEQYLWYTLENRRKNDEIEARMLDWLVERIRAERPGESPPCAVLLVRRTYFPLSFSGRHQEFSAEVQGAEWGHEVIAKRDLFSECLAEKPE